MKTRVHEIFLMIILLCLSKNLTAQERNVYISNPFGRSANIAISRSPSETSDIAGSPYYNRSWMFGELTLKDSSQIRTVFRYDVYNQQLEFIYQNDTFVFARPLLMDNLSLAGKKFIYALELDQNKKVDYLSGGYFEILNHEADSGVQLLAKLFCTVEDKSFSSRVMGGVGSSTRPMYVIHKYYYIRKEPGSSAIKLKKNKKFVYNFFDDHYMEMNAYITENKIRFSKIDDLIRLIDYYNTILTAKSFSIR